MSTYQPNLGRFQNPHAGGPREPLIPNNYYTYANSNPLNLQQQERVEPGGAEGFRNPGSGQEQDDPVSRPKVPKGFNDPDDPGRRWPDQGPAECKKPKNKCCSDRKYGPCREMKMRYVDEYYAKLYEKHKGNPKRRRTIARAVGMPFDEISQMWYECILYCKDGKCENSKHSCDEDFRLEIKSISFEKGPATVRGGSDFTGTPKSPGGIPGPPVGIPKGTRLAGKVIGWQIIEYECKCSCK